MLGGVRANSGWTAEGVATTIAGDLRQSRAVLSTWEPSAVGYLRRVADIYECPVYITSFRGHMYVFLATLKTADPCSKWVLTGTAILMQTGY